MPVPVILCLIQNTLEMTLFLTSEFLVAGMISMVCCKFMCTGSQSTLMLDCRQLYCLLLSGSIILAGLSHGKYVGILGII